MAKSETQKPQKKGKRTEERKRTASSESGGIRWKKGLDEWRVVKVKIVKLEELLDELDKALRKAKPLISEEEALRELYELRRQRAARLLGRR